MSLVADTGRSERDGMAARYLKHLRERRERRGGKVNDLSSYATYVRAFLGFAEGKPLDTSTVAAWLKWQEGLGYKASTVAFMRGVARTLFKVNGLPWANVSGLDVQAGDSEAPAADPRDVKDMILSVRELADYPDHRAALALSTTYGLRREEMTRLTPQSFERQGKDLLLHFEVAKTHGETRVHYVPPEIQEPLLTWGFKQPWSLSKLWGVWLDIEEMADIPHVEGMGWHSVRRTLTRLLSDEFGAEADILANFMGWRTNRSMRAHYASLQVRSGRYGDSYMMGAQKRELDERVFAVHPWIPFWRRG